MQPGGDATAQSALPGAHTVSQLLPVLKHHGLLLAAAAAIMAYGNILSQATGHTTQSSVASFVYRYVVMAGSIVLITGLIVKFSRMIFVERPESPIRAMGRWIAGDVLAPASLINGVFGMAAVFALVNGFSKAKNNVARFEDYNWDAFWSAADRALHGGYLPHELLQPILGNATATRLIDLGYWLWYPVLFSACFAAAFQPVRSIARHRFLLALIFTWGIGGGMLSILFSSGGPVYFGTFAGLPDPYAAHMAFLREVNATHELFAVYTQELLWAEKSGNGLSMISAMPSMHVAITALIWIACQSLGPVLRILSTVFTIMIVVGSVHLGWHYAVDTYAGILIALLSWQVALPVSRWYLTRTGTCPAA